MKKYLIDASHLDKDASDALYRMLDAVCFMADKTIGQPGIFVVFCDSEEKLRADIPSLQGCSIIPHE